MGESHYELDGQDYVWTGTRWYRRCNYVTPPGALIGRLNKLLPDQKPQSSAPKPSSSRRVSTSRLPKDPVERVREVMQLPEHPSGVERPLIEQWWPQLQKLFNERFEDPDALQEILTELLFRHTDGAVELRARVAERLVELSEDSFLWPTTESPGGDGSLRGDEWPQQGIPGFLGYHVGQNGVRADDRRAILDFIYTGRLPNVNDAAYMGKWGAPKSAKRLHQLANNLATQCRNNKRRKDPAGHWQSVSGSPTSTTLRASTTTGITRSAGRAPSSQNGLHDQGACGSAGVCLPLFWTGELRSHHSWWEAAVDEQDSAGHRAREADQDKADN